MPFHQEFYLEQWVKNPFKKPGLLSHNQSVKKPILVVDDTLENLKLVTAFLNEYEFEVLTAKSGSHALKNFSRLDESELKLVDIHEGIDNTLLILQHRLRAQGTRPQIKAIKNYSQLPLVACYASQLNQVFMNLLDNAIDAVESQPEPRVITISTSMLTKEYPSPNSQFAVIRIADNGLGMSEQVCQQIFDPFFTTKPVGSGTGLGLAISHQIVVEKHLGCISCVSAPGQGTQMIVEIPVNLAVLVPSP